ncbi:hypothetical protein AAHA92_29706 [Salvia divinorum]|uniref:Uncharacterized protein n=1 Tax=Salvia divinorum TaxID=28513 RepID=A0ABD1FZC2_SALDI
MIDEDRCEKSMTDEERVHNFIFCVCAVMSGIIMCIIVSEVMSSHIYIQQLHIREDSSNSSYLNTSIVMDLKFEYPLYSDDLNITLYCAAYQSFSPIGYYVVPGFNDGFRTAHREAVVVPRGPSWDEARRRLAQGSTVELRVEMTTRFVYRENCRHCDNIRESEKCHCSDCPDATPVKVVADFLVDGSGEVSRIS